MGEHRARDCGASMSEHKTLERDAGRCVVVFQESCPVTTDESLSAYFRERGLDIGPECIG